MAVDSCDFYDAFDEKYDCSFDFHKAFISNNFDSSYIYTKRNVFVYFDEYIFKDGFSEMDTLKDINDISEEHTKIKEFYNQIQKQLGDIKLYNKAPRTDVLIEFKEFLKLSQVKNITENNKDIISDLEVEVAVSTYEGVLASIQNNEKLKGRYWSYSEKTNEILVNSTEVKKIEVFNLMGQKLMSREFSFEKLLQLRGNERILIILTFNSKNEIFVEKLIINK